MPSAAELRKQLKELRKDHVKPVSKMRKGDISDEINRLTALRANTPAAAAVPVGSSKKKVPSEANIKDAKRSEYKTKPAPAAAPEKKKSKMERLQELIEGFSSSDEE